jgi:hypothetical protein
VRRVERDELSVEAQRRMHAAREAGGKLLDLLGIVMPRVTDALRVSV